MARYSISELAKALGATALGQGDLMVSGLAEPGLASADQLAVAMDPKYLDALAKGDARAAVLRKGTPWQELGLDAAIEVERPRLAMAGLTGAFAASGNADGTLSPKADIHETAQIGAGTSVAPFAVIEAGAQIGPDSIIGPGAWIGAGVVLGRGARIAANCALYPGVRAGEALFVQAGATLGGDGFSFVTPEPSAVEEVRAEMRDAGTATAPQDWIKISSLGGVEIGDNVEVGANSSIDAGTIRATRVGDGTKLDALVQVGHNAQVGRNCLLCAHVAVGGSAIVGDNSVLGGQVGVADNITLGAGVVAGGATKILSNVPAGRALLGYPAMKMDQQVDLYKSLRRLPRLFARVAGLEEKLASPEKSRNDD